METTLVSVIMPVYNTESRFLEESVRCVIAQSHKKLELIIVDDGSAEETASVCEKLADADERIRVIHQANRGVSAARNEGLSCAKGKFVTFLDADDYYDSDYIESLLFTAEKYDADIVMCGYRHVDEAGHVMKESRLRSGVRMLDRDEAIRALLLMNFAVDISAVFAALYSIELFENIKFEEEVILAEDVMIKFELLKRAKKIFWIGRNLMNYRIQKNSAMRSTLKIQHMKTLEYFRKFIGHNAEFEKELLLRYLRLCFVILFMNSGPDALKEQKEYIRQEIISHRREALFFRGAGMKLKAALLTTYLGFSVTWRLYHIGGK